jgi:hypothetical protein
MPLSANGISMPLGCLAAISLQPGERHGAFTIIAYSHSEPNGRRYRARCDHCQSITTQLASHIRAQFVKSCGCLLRQSKASYGERMNALRAVKPWSKKAMPATFHESTPMNTRLLPPPTPPIAPGTRFGAFEAIRVMKGHGSRLLCTLRCVACGAQLIDAAGLNLPSGFWSKCVNRTPNRAPWALVTRALGAS